MLAGIFIYGGLDAVRDPESKAKAAADIAPKVAGALHLPTTDTVTLVRINGTVQVVAGTLMALGKWRRLSALALAASLVPTTYAGHRFWDELDEDKRAQQRFQFAKNIAILGGLVLAAGDTGGRPSVGWLARRATKHAVEATVAAGAIAQEAARSVAARESDMAANTTTAARHVAKKARKAAAHAQKAVQHAGIPLAS
jgi:uncharacterized membrane protein YphA (DoxX/SURF4 family)